VKARIGVVLSAEGDELKYHNNSLDWLRQSDAHWSVHWAILIVWEIEFENKDKKKNGKDDSGVWDAWRRNDFHFY
jgi:hypothetical protein